MIFTNILLQGVSVLSLLVPAALSIGLFSALIVLTYQGILSFDGTLTDSWQGGLLIVIAWYAWLCKRRAGMTVDSVEQIERIAFAFVHYSTRKVATAAEELDEPKDFLRYAAGSLFAMLFAKHNPYDLPESQSWLRTPGGDKTTLSDDLTLWMHSQDSE